MAKPLSTSVDVPADVETTWRLLTGPAWPQAQDAALHDASTLVSAEPTPAGGATMVVSRLLPDGTIGRMAVASAVRGQGIGAEVLARLEDRARERGLPSVELHAQLHARAFYDKAGYASYGGVYVEAGIDHVSMRKQLR